MALSAGQLQVIVVRDHWGGGNAVPRPVTAPPPGCDSPL